GKEARPSQTNRPIGGEARARDQSSAGRVGGIEGETRDRERRLLVGERGPGCSTVCRLPDSAGWRADKQGVRIQGIGHHWPYPARNVPIRGRIPALYRERGAETGGRALRHKTLVDLELCSCGSWQRERCRDDEPAQRSAHDTPPAAQTPRYIVPKDING